jgi:hypothetical protein
LPTFLFVDRSSWRPVSASASDGLKTVTASARPSRVAWEMAEPGRADSSFVCAGPGSGYDPTGPAMQVPECGYTYRLTSAHAGRRSGYPVTATVSWQISWTCTGACAVAGGRLPPLRTTSRAALPVRQARSQLESGT